ncbi:MAG: ribonuclease P protein component [Melioribacteraceae bacterium]|nr:ribonuclease P protein component [Melioribacteraceae bacterium]MCF8265108.1 ribonuclease P protein component [Melioribacteraceae bacterium]MCF8413227.1 ribonuclease P protein component [Melioribacteraceae bacterium]MCF8431232.1 ribonuclease P protein component [Melioribacteraceae bacterium]
MKKFGLSKQERIKSKNDFRKVYSFGKVLISKQGNLKVTYYCEENSEESGVKAAFAVHRKSGKAVWRNRVRRLLKESYRKNKLELKQSSQNYNLLLLLVFSLYSINQKKNPKIALKNLEPDAIDLIRQITNQIVNKYGKTS